MLCTPSASALPPSAPHTPKEPGQLGQGAGIHVRTGLRCLCGHGLETTAHGEHLVPATSACAAQCQGLGAAVGTTPQLLQLLLEPLLRSGTKDRKHSSGCSKDPTTPGTECTECRRNSQRTPENLVQASCCCYRVIQEWIFNVCEQQMVLSTSVVKSWQ